MSDKEIKNESPSNKPVEDESIEERRKRLKQILAGGGMFVGAAAMQKEWTRPVIDSVILPVHAQTSSLNGSFTAQASVSSATGLLDYVIPQAHAGVSSFDVEICINVVNGVANVEVTVAYDWWLYVGSAALDFNMFLSPSRANGGNHDVVVIGSYDEATNTIIGEVLVDGAKNGYTAVPSTATCALTPPLTPPSTTTPSP